jgi:small-conductance mechanosensitive channel
LSIPCEGENHLAKVTGLYVLVVVLGVVVVEDFVLISALIIDLILFLHVLWPLVFSSLLVSGGALGCVVSFADPDSRIIMRREI